MQLMPAPHCSELPHRQPPTPQLSARSVSQLAQVAPVAPQWLMLPGVRQLVPLQQPSEHEVASQTQVAPTQR